MLQCKDIVHFFHESRNNRQKLLYLECVFPESWNNELYLAVLEDNPYHKWNDSMDPTVVERVDRFFHQMEIENELQGLYQQIDESLEKADELQFHDLTKKVKELLRQKEEAT